MTEQERNIRTQIAKLEARLEEGYKWVEALADSGEDTTEDDLAIDALEAEVKWLEEELETLND